jgi:hypothetical protein
MVAIEKPVRMASALFSTSRTRLLPLVLGFLGVSIFTRYIVTTWSDPTLCRAMFQDGGRWLDPARAYNDSGFTQWQPPGCMMHSYSWDEVQSSFNGGRMLFLGDSTTRGLFQAFMQLHNSSWELADSDKGNPHHFFASNVTMHQEFDQYLDKNVFLAEWDAFRSGKQSPNTTVPFDLVFSSVGLHHVRFTPENGTTAWSTMLDRIFPTVDNTSITTDLDTESASLLTRSEYIFSPVQIPDIPSMRTDIEWYYKGNGETLNTMLREHSLPSWVVVPWSYTAMTAYDHAFVKHDGIHSVMPINKAKLTLMLNWHFNEQNVHDLGTCCVPYPVPHWWQWIVILFLFAMILRQISHRSSTDSNGLSLSEKTMNLQGPPSLLYLGLALALCFISDRTFILQKEAKYFAPTSIPTCCLVLLVMALCLRGHIELRGIINSKQYLISGPICDELLGLALLSLSVLNWCGELPLTSPVQPLVAMFRQVSVLSGLFLLAYRTSTAGSQSRTPRRIGLQFIRVNMLAICLDLTLPGTLGHSKVIYSLNAILASVHLILYLQSMLCRAAGHTPSSLVLGISQVLRPEYIFSSWLGPSWLQIELLGTSIYVYNCFAAICAGLLVATVQAELYSTEHTACCGREVIHHDDSAASSRRSATATQIVAMIVNVWVVLIIPLYQEDAGVLPTSGLVHLYLVISTAIIATWLFKAHCSTTALGWLGQHAFEIYLLQQHLWLASDGSARLSLGLLQYVPALARTGVPQICDLGVTSVLLCWLASKVLKETKSFAGWAADRLEECGVIGLRLDGGSDAAMDV